MTESEIDRAWQNADSQATGQNMGGNMRAPLVAQTSRIFAIIILTMREKKEPRTSQWTEVDIDRAWQDADAQATCQYMGGCLRAPLVVLTSRIFAGMLLRIICDGKSQ